MVMKLFALKNIKSQRSVRVRTQPHRRATRPRRRSRARGRLQLGRVVGGARQSLRGFRHASMLAVALTGLLLLVFAPQQAAAPADSPTLDGGAQAADSDAVPFERKAGIDKLVPQATGELQQALDNLLSGFLLNLPKFVVAVLVLLIAWMVARLLRRLVRRLSSRWERGEAIGVLMMAGFWLFALAVAVSIMAGDLRALLGSLGLVGLALSWALQTPIEGFTAWLLNSFKGYYRVGDRIAVGDIFGDVYKIDVLTTTIWEIGGPDRSGAHVQAEQPTGRLITFPNNEILTGTVVNLTRDFPFVWHEVEILLASETDLNYALAVFGGLANDALKSSMQEPAHRYAAILEARGLEATVPDRPQLYVSLSGTGVLITIRYLVDARKRRLAQSELTRRIYSELQKPEHAGRIVSFYPRQQVQIIDTQGHPKAGSEK